jgi:hypothetical protein
MKSGFPGKLNYSISIFMYNNMKDSTSMSYAKHLAIKGQPETIISMIRFERLRGIHIIIISLGYNVKSGL